MILSGPRVDLITAVGSDWEYILDLADKHDLVKCSRDLVLEFARVNNFIAFIVYDKDKKRLGTVLSNYIENTGFTVDLYVGEGNAGYIPECFDLFTGFMSTITDRLYGYTLIGDEKMIRLGEVFGFEKLGEKEGYIITMREI